MTDHREAAVRMLCSGMRTQTQPLPMVWPARWQMNYYAILRAHSVRRVSNAASETQLQQNTYLWWQANNNPSPQLQQSYNSLKTKL